MIQKGQKSSYRCNQAVVADATPSPDRLSAVTATTLLSAVTAAIHSLPSASPSCYVILTLSSRRENIRTVVANHIILWV